MAIKVLFLLDSLSPVGGAERVAVKIAIGLKRSGNYAPIFCSTREGGGLEEELKANGIGYMLLKRRRFSDVHKFKPLIDLLGEEKIKIIHSHNLGSNLWGSIIGSIARVPVLIAHKHGQDYSTLRSLVLDKIVGNLSQKIIFVSNDERKAFIQRIGADPEKCVTVYNGISIDNPGSLPEEKTRNDYGIQNERVVIGIIARFAPEKDHETFLLAAREVLRTNGKFTFLLVGDGKTKPSMQKLSKDLGIDNNTIFTGFVDDPREVLPIIDIGCLTSRREGMGIVLLEYMAFRKPVVSTNAGGIPEVVQEGVNGFLVDPGDYKSMAGKIIELAQDANLRTGMGQEGFSILNAKFTDKIMVNNIEKLYDQSLEAAGVTKQ